jgi:predicted RNase H-like nuclease
LTRAPATFIGFDSAWADNPKAPGAICIAVFDGARFTSFTEPCLVGFDAAAALIRAIPANGPIIVAIDQPTIVRNPTGMRAAERVAASVISWAGGGVQPANRGRIGMFDDGAPIWRFLRAIEAIDDPMRARTATSGVYIMESFPALALISFDARFFGRRLGPRYNPARKTFRIEHWAAVVEAVSAEAVRLGCPAVADWLVASRTLIKPRKADQDRLDAVICLLIAIRWRHEPPDASIMIGDLKDGYIVAPASPPIRERLEAAAMRYSVAIDGNLSSAR